jgi:hypothetical protein
MIFRVSRMRVASKLGRVTRGCELARRALVLSYFLNQQRLVLLE